MTTPRATPTLPSAPKCTTATPDHHGYVPPTACNANYGFYPSWEWNLVFAIGFFLASLLHIAQLLATRKWFCWVVVMGALWEYACFVLRTLGAFDQQNGGLVVVSTLLFLLAPLWINAFVYMVVARLIYFLLPPYSQNIFGMSPRWLAKAFVAVDVVSFFIQAAGGGMLADQDRGDTVKTGQHIYMAGIGVQLTFVVIFAVITVLFTVRLERSMGAGQLEARHNVTVTRHLVWSMLAVIGLIVVRIVFRFVEFSGGVSSSNPILANEAYQLGLDALPMLIALLLMNAVHPGKVLKGPDSSFPRIWPRRWKGKSGNEHELLQSSSVDLNGQRYGQE
ncbi:RTA1 like protein-domain-containing protein [Chaetomium fimeti]|uniref:RTA1 like protein-domain-containing protein n=1 Tax=Chaetomium fimeti TaxID=1854472 RepID=A0AAE0H7M5_9PEZI|nr:RTA1 like protein-domain-containing protein [Chaetomium fimeti]